MLNVLEPIRRDDSIISLETRHYLPYANSSFNHGDLIRIPIQNANSFINLNNSYLYIEGKVSDITLATNQTNKKINMIKNFFMYLFEEIKLELNSIVIDQVKNTGVTTTIKNYLTIPSEQEDEATSIQWQDSNLVIGENGVFSVNYPLRNIFGVAADYLKVFIYSRLELVLLRSRTDTNLYQDPNHSITSVKIQVTKLILKAEHVIVADHEKFKLLKILEGNKDILVPFRSIELVESRSLPQIKEFSWTIKSSIDRPLYVIVTFQTEKIDNTAKDASVFDHCDIKNCKLYLNDQCYPYHLQQFNWTESRYDDAYVEYCNFFKSFCNKPGQVQLDYKEFKKFFPALIFNCSYFDTKTKVASCDIKLQFEFEKDFPANTIAYCALIFDNIIKYNCFSGSVNKLLTW